MTARWRSWLAGLLIAAAAIGSPVQAADAQARPRWVDGAVIYGVVPPLFGNPPYRAVMRRLDALKAQGVDALWLSPLNRTDDPGAISYSITDEFKLRADFGSEAELRALVKAAHARGIKVLVDVVPNHVSAKHPFFLDAQARGEASPYYRWFDRDAKGRPTHYFDWKHLENLDYRNPEVEQMMIDAFLHWVKAYGVDGFRVDAAWGPQRRNPDFWPKLVKALRKVKPDVFLLAEASARDPYWMKAGFDAAYDWTPELGHWAWAHVFDDPAHAGEKLALALAHAETPPDHVARFLENNDTGRRFISRHGLATTRVAAVLLHTLPGIPVLFTGQEVGAEYQPYDDPPPLSFADPHQLIPLYAHLAALREQLPALRHGAFRPVPVPDHPAVYAFVRDAGGSRQALVVLDFGKPARLRLQLPPGFPAPKDGVLHDALTGEDVAVERTPDGALGLAVEGQSALILTPNRLAAPGPGR